MRCSKGCDCGILPTEKEKGNLMKKSVRRAQWSPCTSREQQRREEVQLLNESIETSGCFVGHDPNRVSDDLAHEVVGPHDPLAVPSHLAHQIVR